MRVSGSKPHIAILAVMLAAALAAGVIERKIPFQFAVPGVKLGLSNAVILAALYLFRIRDAVKIAFLKWLLISIFTGFGVSALYGLGGGLLSFSVMALAACKLPREKVSPLGVSVLGAVAHNIGQIFVAAAIMRTFSIAVYLPVLIISGVITGLLVGLITYKLIAARSPKSHVCRAGR